jgi:hypothetical protein
VQTTLLGLAIAIILALVAALVGPYFIDWNQYRAEFESNASRLTGLRVRVAGPIVARLLPTPTFTLSQIEIARRGDAGALRARTLGVEFDLGALTRGEWRATSVRLEGADFAIGLDGSGRLDWPAPLSGVEADAISIQKLEIVDGRAILADAASGSRVVLDKLEFQGELRSLVGPLKGEGSFVTDGLHYPYRIAAGRPGDDGAVRLRLTVDPIDRPLTAEADGVVWIERGVPRFEGTLNLARPVRPAPAGAPALIIEPWRLSTKFKGDATAAVLEQVEFQYGPDDRAIKLRGDAKLTLGPKPQFDGTLAATQVDLDRLLGLPEATRRRPLVAVKSFADFFAGAPRPPIPVKLGIAVENVMLAGATLVRVSSKVKSDGATWDVEAWTSARPAPPSAARGPHRHQFQGHHLRRTGQGRSARSPRARRLAHRSRRRAGGRHRSVPRRGRGRARQRGTRHRQAQGGGRSHGDRGPACLFLDERRPSAADRGRAQHAGHRSRPRLCVGAGRVRRHRLRVAARGALAITPGATPSPASRSRRRGERAPSAGRDRRLAIGFRRRGAGSRSHDTHLPPRGA